MTTTEQPRLERVSGKIAQLERMADYREGKLESGRHGDPDFLRAEVSALRAGILALRYYRSDVDRLDEPLLVLSALVDALDGVEDAPGSVTQAVDRARALLEEWT